MVVVCRLVPWLDVIVDYKLRYLSCQLMGNVLRLTCEKFKLLEFDAIVLVYCDSLDDVTIIFGTGSDHFVE